MKITLIENVRIQGRYSGIIRSFALYWLVLIFLLGSCGKPSCKREKLPRYDYPPEMHRFFDVYKGGNWWVYATTDKSKRDSVYIANYTETEGANCQEKVITWSRRMNIFSTYIFDDNANRISVYQTAPSSARALLVGYRTNFQYIFDGTSIREIASEAIVEIVPSLEVNGITYTNVISSNRVKIAENVGIIYTVFEGDTFLLKKHHVQP